MPLSEESDPSGKRQKQPCTGATTAAEKAGTTDAQRAAAPAFFLFARYAGPLTLHRLQQPAPAAHRLHRAFRRRPACCIPCQRRPPALCQHTADRRALLHRLHTASPAAASAARRLAAPARSPPRPACFGADRWPAGPARLPDRRRAGAARPAAPPLAMTPRPPPGAGPMTTARPPRARRYWERSFNPLRVRKPENFLGINGFLPFPRRGSEKI